MDSTGWPGDLCWLAGLFARFNVSYAVIGGLAVATHRPSRIPRDVDIVLASGRRSARRCVRALASCRPLWLVEEPIALDAEALAGGCELALRTVVGRLDIVGESLAGIPRDELVGRRTWVRSAGHRFAVCDPRDLVKIKTAVGSPKDLADVELLTRTPEDRMTQMSQDPLEQALAKRRREREEKQRLTEIEAQEAARDADRRCRADLEKAARLRPLGQSFLSRGRHVKRQSVYWSGCVEVTTLLGGTKVKRGAQIKARVVERQHHWSMSYGSGTSGTDLFVLDDGRILTGYNDEAQIVDRLASFLDRGG